MPFTYRDKPRLSERLRGKSGEELLNELKSDFDKGKRMFFESPSWGTRQNISGFPRGFPFDEDRGRSTNIRSYLDDLANRHPEFADQLKEPTWSDDFVDSNFGRKRRGSGEGEDSRNQASGSSGPKQAPTEEEQPRPQNLNQFGLRNTVPLAQAAATSEEERRQRSMSAPPDNRAPDKAKRFVSKCEIPIMHDPTQNSQKAPQEQPQQKSNNSPNVRVIPIQVEGRDEPVINANIDCSANFGGETFREPVFEGRLPRDFGNYQRHSPRFNHQERVPTPTPPPPQQAQPQPPPQSHPQPQPQPPQPPQDETDSKPPTTKPEPPNRDPLTKVQVIQKEVEELMKKVDNFQATSRSDKQYMILDELLTRKLISLDDIDTEGKENVRQARKDTIRSIQRCISTLEQRVPLENNEPNTMQDLVQSKKEGSENPQPMEVDQTKESTPVSSNQENQKMEVDAKNSKEEASESQKHHESTEKKS